MGQILKNPLLYWGGPLLLVSSSFGATPIPATPPPAPTPAPVISGFLSNIDPATSTVHRDGDRLSVITKDAAGKETTTVYQLVRVPKGTLLFHWTTADTPSRWMSQGGMIKPDELDWLDSPNTGMQAFGPGWYVSASPVDSHGFGVSAVVETTPQDFWVLSGTYFRPLDATTAHQTEALLRSQDIIGTQATPTWYTVFDPRAAANLQPLNPKLALDGLMSTYQPPGPGMSRPGPSLQEILRVADLEPHPFFTRYFPELAHLISGQALTPAELDQVTRDATGNPAVERQVCALIHPSQRLDLLKRLVPPNDKAYLAKLLAFDQNVSPLPPAQDLVKVYPRLTDLLSGRPLSSEEHAALKDGVLGAVQSVIETEDTPLARSIRRDFGSEISDAFVHRMGTSSPQASYAREAVIRQARAWGVPLSALDGDAIDPGNSIASSPGQLSYADARNSLDENGRNLLDSFAFMNEGTILHATATGDAHPWTLMDTPGRAPWVDRWLAAKSKKRGGVDDLFARLLGSPPVYRDLPLVQGGPITPPGSTLGYLRVTARQLQVLRQNAYLSVTAIPDPSPPSGAQKSFLARYEYPSVTTYKKFASQLSIKLRADLQAADAAGTLSDPASPEARALTARITRELNDYPGGATPLEQYVNRVSIHASDDSDLFAQLMYAKSFYGDTMPPLLFRDPGQVLLTQPSELAAMRDQGDLRLTVLANALKRAHDLNPAHPDYVDLPELYETAFPSPVPVGDPAAYQAATKAFFQSSDSADPGPGAWALLLDRLEKLPPEQQQSVISAWANANITPKIDSPAQLDSLLGQSLTLAKGADRAVIVRWWWQMAGHPDFAFGQQLAAAIEKLPEDLRLAFRQQWLLTGGTPAVPFSPEFVSQESDFARETYANAPGTAQKALAARFLIESGMRQAPDPKAVDAYLAKTLPDYLKGPSGDAIVAELVQTPDPQERAAYIRAFLELPAGSLTNTSRGIVLQGLLSLDSADQVTLAREALNHPEHWIVSDTWKLLASTHPAGINGMAQAPNSTPLVTLLSDPKYEALLKQNLAKDPARIKVWSSLVGALPADAQTSQADMLQSLIDQKSWPSFLGLLKQNSGQLLYWPFYGPAGTKLQATALSGLKVVAQDSAGDASISFYLQSIMNPQFGSQSLDSMYGNLIHSSPENTRFILKDLLQKMQYSVIIRNKSVLAYNGTLLSDLLKRVVGSGSSDATEQLLELLRMRPRAMDGLKANAELGKALAASLGKLDPTARKELVDAISRLHSPVGDAMIGGIFQGGDPASLLTLEEVIRDPGDPSPRWAILRQGLASSNSDTKKAFVAALLDSGRQAPATAEETDQIAALAAALDHDSYAALDRPEFAALAPARKSLLRNEYDRSLPHKSRIESAGKVAPGASCQAAFSKLAP